jgi:hypothetical protein
MQMILPKVLEKLAARAAEIDSPVDAVDEKTCLYLIQCCSFEQEELRLALVGGNSCSNLFLHSSVASEEVLQSSVLQILMEAVAVSVRQNKTFSSVDEGSSVLRRGCLVEL